MLLKEEYFQWKQGKVKELIISTLKQMLQRIRIALAQVPVGNSSENLINEIIQIIYSVYQGKEITKKEQNNIMNSMKL